MLNGDPCARRQRLCSPPPSRYHLCTPVRHLRSRAIGCRGGVQHPPFTGRHVLALFASPYRNKRPPRRPRTPGVVAVSLEDRSDMWSKLSVRAAPRCVLLTPLPPRKDPSVRRLRPGQSRRSMCQHEQDVSSDWRRSEYLCRICALVGVGGRRWRHTDRQEPKGIHEGTREGTGCLELPSAQAQRNQCIHRNDFS